MKLNNTTLKLRMALIKADQLVEKLEFALNKAKLVRANLKTLIKYSVDND